MTDNEIINALEWHLNNENNCNGCPLITIKNSTTYCVDVLLQNALDLINRQKAEIDRLKANVNAGLQGFASEYDSKIKAEAVKEFAERLKTEATVDDDSTWWIANVDIDNLLKEMVGENNVE